MDLTAIPMHSFEYSLEMTEDGIVLSHTPVGEMIPVNQAMALIWELCDGQRSAAEIIELLCATTPTDADEILGGVQATLEFLLAQGCLELV
jgi:hypothetical protein